MKRKSARVKSDTKTHFDAYEHFNLFGYPILAALVFILFANLIWSYLLDADIITGPISTLNMYSAFFFEFPAILMAGWVGYRVSRHRHTHLRHAVFSLLLFNAAFSFMNLFFIELDLNELVLAYLDNMSIALGHDSLALFLFLQFANPFHLGAGLAGYIFGEHIK